MKYLWILFLMLTICFSCDKPMVEDCENYNFSDCSLDQPDWGLVKVQVTINSENPYVPLTFFRGNIEDNVVEVIDTAYSGELKVDMPLNNYFSVKAIYKSGIKQIIAVDGGDFTTKKYHVCDQDCWVIRGGEYDVRLK